MQHSKLKAIIILSIVLCVNSVQVSAYALDAININTGIQQT